MPKNILWYCACLTSIKERKIRSMSRNVRQPHCQSNKWTTDQKKCNKADHPLVCVCVYIYLYMHAEIHGTCILNILHNITYIYIYIYTHVYTCPCRVAAAMICNVKELHSKHHWSGGAGYIGDKDTVLRPGFACGFVPQQLIWEIAKQKTKEGYLPSLKLT